MRLFLGVFSLLILLFSLPYQALGQNSSRNIGGEIELAVTAGSLLENPDDQPLQLDALNASYENGVMVLQWITAAERNNARYEVERSVRTHDDGVQPWTTLAFVAGRGTTDTLTTYAYYDKGDVAGISQILYRLKQVSFDGSSRFSEAVEATLPAPKAYAVSSYPNPYTISSTIEYDVPSAGRVRLTVYDEQGRHMKTLVNNRRPAGRYRAVFDASNQDPGLYMYRLEMGGRVWVEPILLVE